VEGGLGPAVQWIIREMLLLASDFLPVDK
jgi:hypothetical protein